MNSRHLNYLLENCFDYNILKQLNKKVKIIKIKGKEFNFNVYVDHFKLNDIEFYPTFVLTPYKLDFPDQYFVDWFKNILPENKEIKSREYDINDFEIQENRLYYRGILICEKLDNQLKLFYFQETFQLSNENILRLFSHQEPMFTDYDRSDENYRFVRMYDFG